MLTLLITNKKQQGLIFLSLCSSFIFISSIKELSRLYLEYNKYKETIITKRFKFKFQIFIHSSNLFLSSLTMTYIAIKLNNKLN
jgi:hypothetical protein